MKSNLTEHVECDESYDDIYPSIVKQQPSLLKKIVLRLSLSFERIWNRVCHSKKPGSCL
ncbi:MAG: hypothetical protein R2568_02290 [Candidatus Scalindua sp.]|jgi:hypothetical protein|nr:hypothetical protein [Candidatus Scalindua sp.]MDV5165559.1 hypothetical protein [Candidatus Scalindua sp.]